MNDIEKRILQKVQQSSGTEAVWLLVDKIGHDAFQEAKESLLRQGLIEFVPNDEGQAGFGEAYGKITEAGAAALAS